MDGTIYGIIKGLAIVYAILAIVYLASPLIKQTTIKAIDNSLITKSLYNNNLLLNIII